MNAGIENFQTFANVIWFLHHNEYDLLRIHSLILALLKRTRQSL